MIAVGSDGASNMVGKHNSLHTRLKEEVPSLILVKCTCHSLHLCAEKSSKELPMSLEYLTREIYNWFACSPLRRLEYKQTFDLINTGLDKNSFKQFVQLSYTRWLSRYNAINTILRQWLELQTRFSVAGEKERCYTAQTINNMLQDNQLKLYFVCMKSILYEIVHLNTLFQSDSLDPGLGFCFSTDKISLSINYRSHLSLVVKNGILFLFPNGAITALTVPSYR